MKIMGILKTDYSRPKNECFVRFSWKEILKQEKGRIICIRNWAETLIFPRPTNETIALWLAKQAAWEETWWIKRRIRRKVAINTSIKMTRWRARMKLKKSWSSLNRKRAIRARKIMTHQKKRRGGIKAKETLRGRRNLNLVANSKRKRVKRSVAWVRKKRGRVLIRIEETIRSKKKSSTLKFFSKCWKRVWVQKFLYPLRE